jgi:ABC-type sugar transport system ATPase subunit
VSDVVLSDVSKRFPNGVKAVDGISLTIEDREFAVLVVHPAAARLRCCG